ncbi:MAG: PQQ-binding-like beta-propeller repeat protein [Pirellula sp.]|nr:PQQ-binding-like beta-propeller repeat protein [Pirellula sp.]
MIDLHENVTGRMAWACVLASVLFCSRANADDGERLREAARRGDVTAIEGLLAKGIDVNSPSSYGVTPLATACDHGHIEAARLLIDRGADVNTKDTFYKFTPLGWAVMRRHTEIAKILVAAGAQDADAALSNAVGSMQPEVVRMLIESGKISDAARASAIRAARKMQAAPNAATQPILEILETNLSEEAKRMVDYAALEQQKLDQLKPFEGVYQFESALMTIKINDGALIASEGDSERSLRLEPEGTDTFVARGTTVQFLRDAEKIRALTWKAGESERTFERTANPIAPAPAAPVAELESSTRRFEDFPEPDTNWPQFRGPLSRGIATGNVPITVWDGPSGKNVAWKTSIPGLATSSPIVWDNRVFLTTGVQESDASGFRTGAYGDVESVQSNGECSYRLICVDLETGSVLWEREAARRVPQVKRHAKSSHANATAATDGKHVLAMFGEAGLHCFDMDGNLLWTRDLGLLDSGWFYDRSYQWGFGSSPCIFEDSVIVQCDVQDEAFLSAIDLRTGETRWKTPREEIPTWSSPVAFIAKDGTPMVIATGTKCTAAYHARTGEVLWKMGGFSEIVVPTPQVLPEFAVVTSGYAPVQPIVALRHSARGDLKIPESPSEDSPFLWAQMKGGPYMPTPVVTVDQMTILDNGGILTGLDLATGKRLFRQRLRGEKATAYTASPVACAGHLYCTSEEGTTYVIAMDGKGTVVSQNDLGESVLASPAISQGRLLIRGERNLYCIVPALE